MCGIAGLLHLDGDGPQLDGALAVLMDAQAHRGPDGAGAFITDRVALGSRRLALVDPRGGGQPLVSEDGALQLVANGELYDDASERRALTGRGHRFATGSDCEVLVHRYEERGLDFASGLRGMWGAALWDEQAERLVLARDPYGIKPLVYALLPGRVLAFASELGALLRLADLPRALDPVAVGQMLSFGQVLGERTIVAAVRRVPAGGMLVADQGELRIVRGDGPVVPAAGSAPVSGADVRDALAGSVRAHLRGDTEVGVLLSGGVDSGLLCALAAVETGPGLKTWTVGFGDAGYDERGLARSVARRYGTDHHELVVSAAQAIEHVADVAASFDEPRADATAIPYWLACGAAGAEVKAVLSGEGGDELFGGYQTYAAGTLGQAGAALAALALPAARRLPLSDARLPLAFKLERLAAGAGMPPLERHVRFKELLDDGERAALGLPAGERLIGEHRSRWAASEGLDQLARLQDLDLWTFCSAGLLSQADRAGMAHGVEVRVPFLDREVAAVAGRLTHRQRVSRLRTKTLLRDVAAPLLPATVADGAKKGFVAPVAGWLRGPLEPLMRELLSPGALAAQGVVDPMAAGRLIDQHLARHRDRSRALWGLMALSLWYQAHIARPPDPESRIGARAANLTRSP